MRPSPARAKPHDADSWLPLPDVSSLPEIEELVAPVAALEARHSEGNVRPVHSRPVPSVRPSPARAKPHDPETWFPLVALEALLAPDSTDAPPAPATDLTPTTRQDPESFSPQTWAPEEIPEPPRRRTPAPAPAPAPRPTPKIAPRREQLAQRRRALTKRSRRSGVIILAVATTAAVAAFGAPKLLAGPTDPEVTVSVDGQVITATTTTETVGAFLAEQNIALGTFDSVDPPPDTAIDGGMTIDVIRAFSVTVDIDGEITTVPTSKPTAGQLRDQLGLKPRRVGIKSAPAELAAGATVVYRTFKDVATKIDGADLTERTMADTVAEFLGDYRVVLGPEDRVEPAPETPITDGMTVEVSRVESNTRQVERPIEPPTEYRDNYYEPAGTERVIQEGVPGIMQVTCRKEIVNGVKGECVPISEVPITPPTPRIVERGAGGTASTQLMAGVREGSASWYASPFGSNSCATKEWIPKGTVLTVTNLDTGQSATCVVQDRVEALRVVDLDDDVFAQLAPLSQGVFPVRISGI